MVKSKKSAWALVASDGLLIYRWVTNFLLIWQMWDIMRSFATKSG